MIDKEEAQKAGIKTVDSNELPAERKAQLLAQLKALLPNVINSDGAVDVNVLKTAVGAEVAVDANSRGYTLNFAGKGLAKTMADAPTEKELKIEMTQSKNFDDTENMVIRGDNIEALKLLMQNYEGKVKMIYIDPPYNTASENFIYKDNFRQTDEQLINDLDMQDEAIDFLQTMYGTRTHSGWLSFMYPRLKLARDLLTDDGVIFISIDDNEQANLKLICDEIFGEESFINLISTLINLKGNNSDEFFAGIHEYGLIYAKNKSSSVTFNLLENNDDWDSWNMDEHGYWKRGGILSATVSKTSATTKNNFPIYVSKTDEVSTTRMNPDDVETFPLSSGQKTRWYWSSKLFEERKDEVIVVRKREDVSLYSKQRIGIEDVPHRRAKTVFYKPSYGQGTAELKRLFKIAVFSNPKSTTMIKDILFIFTIKKDDLILDFFAGSGTTGEAVMQLNADDGGNRKFILVQLDEKINKKTSPEAHNFCTENNFVPMISSITIERLNRAGGKIKESSDSKQSACVKGKTCPDVGYKVFSLQNRPEVNTDENHQLHINMNRRTPQDTLYNMIAASGTELHRKITVVEENILYEVAGAYYVLGACKTDIADESNKPIYIDGYADISLDDWMNMVGPDKENLTILY